jgi:uncharacterized cupin superfamily protein
MKRCFSPHCAPPIHHAGETEGFLVLEGEIAFNIRGKDGKAGTGDFVAVPDGETHAFQAIGDGPARLLILNAPGHMHKAFFTGIGTALPDDLTTLPKPSRPDLGAIVKLAEEVVMTIQARQ